MFERYVLLFLFRNMLAATLLSYKADPREHNVVWKANVLKDTNAQQLERNTGIWNDDPLAFNL